MLKRRLPRALGISSCLLGTYLMFSGGITIAKAHLAQCLLERAWQASLFSEPIRPWPGADTFPIAKILIERLDYSAVVLNTVTGEALAFGPGHFPSSATPGAHGNTILAGHRDSHFSTLEHIILGDIIRIEALNGKTLSYRVYALEVVDEHDTSVLDNTDTTELTLITCYPFDAISAGGPLRYVVSAVKVDELGLLADTPTDREPDR